jgi:capsular polysaccharide biosynthesis protein
MELAIKHFNMNFFERNYGHLGKEVVKNIITKLGLLFYAVDDDHKAATVLYQTESHKTYCYQVNKEGYTIESSGAFFYRRTLIKTGYTIAYSILLKLKSPFQKPRLIGGSIIAPWPQQFLTYGDFMMQLLPEIAHIKSLVIDGEVSVFLPVAHHRYVRELLEILNVSDTNLIDTRGKKFKIEIGSRVFFREKESLHELCVHSDLVESLRSAVLPKYCKEGTQTKKLFITRDNGYRLPLNLSSAHRIHLESLGFQIIDPGNFTIGEQITLFSQASIIVGIHGAGMANIMWSNRGSTVIEIFHDHYQFPCYAHLSEKLNFTYHKIISDQKKRDEPFDYTYRETNMKINWDQLMPLIDTNTSVE